MGIVAQLGIANSNAKGGGRLENAEVCSKDVVVGIEIETAGIQVGSCGLKQGVFGKVDAAAKGLVAIADLGGRFIDCHTVPGASNATQIGVAFRMPSVLTEPVGGRQIELGCHQTGLLTHLNLAFAGDGVVGGRPTTCCGKTNPERDGDAFGPAVDLAYAIIIVIALVRDRLQADALRGLQLGVVTHGAPDGLICVGFAFGAGASDRETTNSQRRTHRVGKDRVLAGGNEINPLGGGADTIAQAGLQFRVTIGSPKGAVGLEVAKTSGHSSDAARAAIGTRLQLVDGRGLHQQLPLISAQLASIDQGVGAAIHPGIGCVHHHRYRKGCPGTRHGDGLRTGNPIASLAQQLQITGRLQGWGAVDPVAGARPAFQAEGVGTGGRVVHDAGADGQPAIYRRRG